jgi:hypothetical protein
VASIVPLVCQLQRYKHFMPNALRQTEKLQATTQHWFEQKISIKARVIKCMKINLSLQRNVSVRPIKGNTIYVVKKKGRWRRVVASCVTGFFKLVGWLSREVGKPVVW